jgi:cyanophycinase-like exopeptidase
MKVILFVLICLVYSSISFGQAYSSAIQGDTSNFIVSPQKKLCLMGGATEDDNAINWWLQGAQGGDVVVIRVSGSLTSYNTYFSSATFNANLNSVETIIIPSIAAANHPYVKRRLREAEAIWIAGGNQNLYRTYWKNTAVDSAINWAYNSKGACIGGTSAGMMIQGQFYYYAGNSSVTSANALSNPFNTDMTLAYDDFLHIPYLQNVITDTHFDNPDRRGRLMSFLARNTTTVNKPLAIACDEYTAVCVDSNGMAKVFGGAPTYSDNAYFLQVNCVSPNAPEVLSSGAPLTFNRNNAAVKVYHIEGDATGSKTFNLNDWQTANGGLWENWYVQSGVFNFANSTANTCVLGIRKFENFSEKNDNFYFNTDSKDIEGYQKKYFSKIVLNNLLGQKFELFNKHILANQFDVNDLNAGIYFINFEMDNKSYSQKIIIE